eukprot:gene11024-biopygen4265
MRSGASHTLIDCVPEVGRICGPGGGGKEAAARQPTGREERAGGAGGPGRPPGLRRFASRRGSGSVHAPGGPGGRPAACCGPRGRSGPGTGRPAPQVSPLRAPGRGRTPGGPGPAATEHRGSPRPVPAPRGSAAGEPRRQPEAPRDPEQPVHHRSRPGGPWRRRRMLRGQGLRGPAEPSAARGAARGGAASRAAGARARGARGRGGGAHHHGEGHAGGDLAEGVDDQHQHGVLAAGCCARGGQSRGPSDGCQSVELAPHTRDTLVGLLRAGPGAGQAAVEAIGSVVGLQQTAVVVKVAFLRFFPYRAARFHQPDGAANRSGVFPPRPESASRQERKRGLLLRTSAARERTSRRSPRATRLSAPHRAYLAAEQQGGPEPGGRRKRRSARPDGARCEVAPGVRSCPDPPRRQEPSDTSEAQPADGVGLDHLQVHLVAEQVPDVVDPVEDHRRPLHAEPPGDDVDVLRQAHRLEHLRPEHPR